MTEWCRCMLSLTVISAASFFVGRLCARIAPARCFDAERFPYHPFRWEREGCIYERLHVASWKERVPDMSRLFRRDSRVMPDKRLPANMDVEAISLMLRETCVAEWVHGLLCLVGLLNLLFRKTGIGRLLGFLYALGNVPYMLIQRYNRPKLLRIRRRLKMRENKGGIRTHEACRNHP